MKQRVLIFGASGMLGAMIVDVLASNPKLELTATVREVESSGVVRLYPGVEWRGFNAEKPGSDSAAIYCAGFDWVINAIGITKPLIRDDNPEEIERAIVVNSLFPQWLGKSDVPVLQIATDCVYSGQRGRYAESDAHDALDVYGKTKSLGECRRPNVHHLRCSIIGPEPSAKRFLLEWFLKQNPSAELSGYANHDWNGVTTLQFARFCQGVIEQRLSLGHMQHVIPQATVTKFELLQSFAQHFCRHDIRINSVYAHDKVDRTLTTRQPEANTLLWQAAGYANVPSVDEMVMELAQYCPRFASNQLANIT